LEDPTSPPEPEQGPGAPEPTSGSPAGAVEFLSLGLTWAVVLAAGAGLGYLVDRWLGTTPVFTLIGLVGAVVLDVCLTVVRVRKYL
jgi:F0F1-type ATP synthase assembly protein I